MTDLAFKESCRCSNCLLLRKSSQSINRFVSQRKYIVRGEQPELCTVRCVNVWIVASESCRRGVTR